MAEKVTVVARVRAKPGLEQQVADALNALVQPTRNEPGCINYDLHRSSDDKTVFLLYENWISKKDLDEHFEMSYLKDFLTKSAEILAEPVDLTFWEMVTQPAR